MNGHTLSYNDYVQGISVLTPEEQLNLIEIISENLKRLMRRKADIISHESSVDHETENSAEESARFLERLRPLVEAGGIVLPTKPKEPATMPTITVRGTPLSQIIIEDRR